MTEEDQQPEVRRRRRRRIGITIGLLALCAVLVWGFVAVSVLLEARDRAESGREALRDLSGLDPLVADLDQVQRDVRVAADDLAEARGRLSSGVLVPLRPLPVLGRQLASARALATTADDVVAAVAPVVDRVLEGRVGSNEPGERLALLAELDERLTHAQAVLNGVDLGPDEALLAPLADARNDASAELGELSVDVGDALTVVRGLRSFLGGSRYTVLAANPAEMANAGGMYLSVGELRSSGGELRLDEFVRSDDVFPVRSGGADDPDVAARWAHIVPGNDFRKLNLTPRFASYSGPRALDLWQVIGGRRPTGAVVVDPVVIQAILAAVGPVEFEGTSYDADSILDYTLVGQYEVFGDNEDQAQRRELVAGIAGAAVEAMGVRSWDPIELIKALRPAAEGRHLLAYSEDLAQQAMWSLLDVDGALAGDELLVNLANVGGQKIDPFLDVDITAAVSRQSGINRLRLEVSVENNTPADISEFAGGGEAALGDEEPGTYMGRLAVFAPAGATAIRLQPEVPFEAYGRDGHLLLAATRVQVDRGGRADFTVEIELADGYDHVTVLPTGRVPAITWHWGERTWDDTRPRTIELR